MKCPKCSENCERDSVDVGVGVIHGPYGCYCGWSEYQEYDMTDPRYDPDSHEGETLKDGWTKDQWGGLNPPIKEFSPKVRR